MLRQQTFIYEPNITIYDIYTSQWPFYYLTFKCDLDLQLIWTNVSNVSDWAKLFWNPCINVEDRTSSIVDHFINWASSETLTFNLPEQMFQMALLLHKNNNCAKLFWNPCINVEVMARQIQTGAHTMHAHTLNWSCNDYVLLTTSGLDKNKFQFYISIIYKYEEATYSDNLLKMQMNSDIRTLSTNGLLDFLVSLLLK